MRNALGDNAKALECYRKEKTGYQVATVMEDITFKEARNQYLQLEIARLESPAVVSAQARERLKMDFTKPSNVVVLED